MALFNFFHETEADSAYDKGPIRYFDAYRLTNKSGASYHHFSIGYIDAYIYIYIYIYIGSVNFLCSHRVCASFHFGLSEVEVPEYFCTFSSQFIYIYIYYTSSKFLLYITIEFGGK